MFPVLLILGWFVGGKIVRVLFALDAGFYEAEKSKALVFREDYAGGRCLWRFPFGMAGASWSLTILVTETELWVWPMKLPRPTFMARVLGLERRIRLCDVSVERVEPSLFGQQAVTLRIKTHKGCEWLMIYLKSSERFLRSNAGLTHRTTVG